MTIHELLAEKDKLLEQLKFTRESVIWWGEQVLQNIMAINILEAQPYSPERDTQLEKLHKHFDYLATRAEVEKAAVTKLEKMASAYIVQEQAFLKNVKKET